MPDQKRYGTHQGRWRARRTISATCGPLVWVGVVIGFLDVGVDPAVVAYPASELWLGLGPCAHLRLRSVGGGVRLSPLAVSLHDVWLGYARVLRFLGGLCRCLRGLCGRFCDGTLAGVPRPVRLALEVCDYNVGCGNEGSTPRQGDLPELVQRGQREEDPGHEAELRQRARIDLPGLRESLPAFPADVDLVDEHRADRKRGP